MTVTGTRMLRKEDPELLSGEARFVDDLAITGALWLGIVRSPFAHARIGAIDTSAAEALPGVVAVYTGAQLVEMGMGALPCAWAVTEDMVTPEHLPVAVSEASFAGDAVAVVLARSRYQAQDALDAVEVDYDPLPAVVDLEAAATDETLAHTDLESNTSYVWELIPDPDAVEAAFANANHTITERYLQQRLIPTAMEPRGVAVVPQPQGGEITIWSATQIPHILKLMVAATTGTPEHKVRVIAPSVGGGFGCKLNVYAEELLAVILAKHHGVPVRWTEERTEAATSTIQGRGQVQDIELAADADGKVTAVRATLLADMGAYLQLVTPGIPLLGAFLYHGVYDIPAYSFTCTGLFTNLAPTDAYRGAGRPEASYAIERAMDALAREIGVTPEEIRRRNYIPSDAFPYDSPAGLVFDSGDYEPSLDRALELAGIDELRAEQQRLRDEGSTTHLGIGLCTYVEMCGLAPSRVLASLNYGAGGWESATVRMLATGSVQVVTGSSPHGQGHETTWSQLVADQLGIDPQAVEVLHSDTAVSALGLDTYGSRSAAVGGTAIHLATEQVLAKARDIAAHQLEASADDLEFDEGSFHVRGSPDKSVAIGDVAMAAFTAHDLPDGMEPNLTAQVTYDPPNFVFPFGTHVAVIEIDEETGGIRLRDYIAVDDCGNQINPMIVDGQLHGGILQGVAQALWEGAVYDDEGNLTNCSLADYLVPSTMEAPSFTLDSTVTPSPTNPLGVKGIGEAGTIGSAAAVMNAVVDALGPLGITDIDMPASPNRVWAAIQEARSVIPAAFDYVRADSADEALALLAEHGDEAKLMAGGHSLLPLMKFRLAVPAVVIDIGRLEDLSYIREDGDTIAIGALTRHRDLETSEVLKQHLPLLAHVASKVGDPQVRHRGTFGGSLSHGDPASDHPAVLLALDGELVIRGPGGERTVPADEFFTGFLETALAPDELLTEVRIPKATGAGWSFQKFNRRAQDWAIVGVAAVQNGRTGIGLVNMDSTPVRAAAAEQAMAGGASPSEAAEVAADGTNPPADLNGTVEFREHLARVLVRRALEEATA